MYIVRNFNFQGSQHSFISFLKSFQERNVTRIKAFENVVGIKRPHHLWNLIIKIPFEPHSRYLA